MGKNFDDHFCSKVKVSYINGDEYDGQFKDGNKSGYGEMQYKGLIGVNSGSLEWGHY